MDVKSLSSHQSLYENIYIFIKLTFIVIKKSKITKKSSSKICVAIIVL